jgi:hypothetical protein
LKGGGGLYYWPGSGGSALAEPLMTLKTKEPKRKPQSRKAVFRLDEESASEDKK